jgi:release factor glutamine methyltransferase
VTARAEPDRAEALVARLRAAGSVFAEEEAAIILGSASDEAVLERMLRRRESGEPLEHVVGRVRFGSLDLAIGPGVFVPRQRSLLLARAAVRDIRSRPHAVLLEAYCGVAPIAATVAAAVPAVTVHVADHDPRALAYARRNVPDAAGAHLGDGLGALPGSLRARCSLIVAVPPYVPADALSLMPREAREREPGSSLSGGPDGLDHVRTVIAEAARWTTDDGRVLVELHRTQYRTAAAEARRAGWIAAGRRGSDGQTVLLDLRTG